MATIDSNLLAALEFGSAAMLGWLAAAVLPWLIHRWHRQRHQEISWAAVELLMEALRQRARRVRLQQWLLLAIRTAILVLVAIAAAEPALRGWTASARGTARTHYVLVLDQSYSMRCSQQGQTRFARAQAAARRLVESARSGDAFSVIGWSLLADNVLGRHTFEPALAREVINELQVLDTNATLPVAYRAIEIAIDRAAKESPAVEHHRVVWFTDLGSNTWAPDATGKRSSAIPTTLVKKTAKSPWEASPDAEGESKSSTFGVGRRLPQSRDIDLAVLLTTLAEKAELVVEDVGDSLRDNVAVTRLTVKPKNVLRQREVAITAQVRGYGNQNWQKLILDFSVDGVRVEQKPFELDSDAETDAETGAETGAETEVRFEYRFVDEGRHTLQVEVVGADDPLPTDDRRLLVVDVLPAMRVACISGRRGAADDFARALAPSSAATIHAEVFPASRMQELDLAQYSAVALCNVGDFSRREAAAVQRYVRSGGALVVLLGDEVEGARYQEAFAATGFLPVEIGPLSAAGDYRFNPLEYRHAIVAPFRNREKAGLLSVVVTRYFQLLPRPDRPHMQTALAFDSGDPAIVIGHFGQGSVAVVATPGSLASRTADGTPWSSFALSPSFLPIVRELVSHLAGERALEIHNRVVGQPLVHRLKSSKPAEELWIELPAGTRQSVSAMATENRGSVISVETSMKGLYEVGSGEQKLARFAVNLDTLESDLAVARAEELPAGVTLAARKQNQGSILRSGYQAGVDMSLVPPLLAAALALLLAELLVAWLMGRGWG